MIAVTVTRNALEDFRRVSAAKRSVNGAMLVSLRATIETAYENYERLAPNLEHIAPVGIGAQAAAAMLHAYERRTKPLAELRRFIFELGKPTFYRCLYCGIDRASHLDHYLEKTDYPEFAIFFRNLVPSCGICNTARGPHAVNNVRQMLHPYEDPIGSLKAMIKADVDIVDNQPWFRFSLLPAVTALEKLFVAHCSTFKLLRAYAAEGAELVSRLGTSVRASVDQGLGLNAIRKSLEAQAVALAAVHGCNHYEVAIHGAVAGSTSFLQYCGAK